MVRLTWEPGNMTKYEVVLVQLTEDALGHSKGDWLVVGPWSSGGMKKAMGVTADGSPLHWSYVAEKLDMNETDASCLAIMIGTYLSREAITVEGLQIKRPFRAVPAH